MSGGGFAVANSLFSKEGHYKATLESGRGLNQNQRVKALVENGPEAIDGLKRYGVPMVEIKGGYRVIPPSDSMQLGGVQLLKPLVERLKSATVQILPGLIVFDLVVEEGAVRGAFGFLKDGRPCLIQSNAVILASGGAGALYRRNDNTSTILGDGYALALRAGLPVFDIEFVQFYPLACADYRLPNFAIPVPCPNETRLINKKGEDLFERLGIKKNLNHSLLTERDRISRAFYEAAQQGDVYCDLTAVPTEKWEHYPLNTLRKLKFSFHDQPVLVSPTAHFFMGGLELAENGSTALPGLFAAGEVTWGIHGSNRLGGNALTECAVFGTIGGRSAAEYVLEKACCSKGTFDLFSETSLKKWETRAKNYLTFKEDVLERPAELLKNLKDLAWKYAGVVREEGSMKEGLAQLAALEKRIEGVHPNVMKDILIRKELENGALIIKAILQGSLLRAESRGSFFRKDFPEQDDQNWKKNTCYRLVNGEFEISHRPVKLRNG